MAKIKQYRTFAEWFDPYDPSHINWARQYLSHEPEDGIIPDDVVLPNHYGIREHVLQSLATAWILYKLDGMERAPITH